MTGFLARRLANYVLLCLAATFHHRRVWGPLAGPVRPIRTTEPRGRRIDSPAFLDSDALGVISLRRQLQADAVLLTLALWWAALRGADLT